MGSFDPFTLGHHDMVCRALPLFSRLVIGVGINERKQYLLTAEQRVEAIRRIYADQPKIAVKTYSDLTIDFAHREQAAFIIKGVRNMTDFDSEMQMARINQGIDPALETLLLPARAEFEHFSSTMAREMIRYHQPLEKYVPAPVAEELMKGCDR